jgi:hypothetical protein
MYDNIDLGLNKSDVKNIDFLSEVSTKLENISQHQFDNGNVSLTGLCDGLKVSVSEYSVKIKNQSLCKWYFGNNFETLSKSDVKNAIGKISDLLSLPISESNIYRIDLAQNFIMKFNPKIYLNHLGNLHHYNRLEQSKGLYFNNKQRQLVFYDKVSESQAKGFEVPNLYKDRAVLRYELRYKSRLPAQFKVPELKAKLLYEDNFYNAIVTRWYDEYQQINKIRETTIFDYSMIKTKKQLSHQAIIMYVSTRGGEIKVLTEIQEAQQKGLLTPKQAFDLRQQIKEACKSELLTVQSDLIAELDSKVKQAYKFTL